MPRCTTTSDTMLLLILLVVILQVTGVTNKPIKVAIPASRASLGQVITIMDSSKGMVLIRDGMK